MQSSEKIGGLASRAGEAKQFAMAEGHGARCCLDGGIGRGCLRFEGWEKVVSMAIGLHGP